MNTTLGSSQEANNKANAMKDRKAILSTLWTFVTLNYLYCDVLSLFDSETLKSIMTGTVGGFQFTPEFMLGAAVLMEIPIASVLLSRTLKYGANRWANIIAGAIMTVIQSLSLFAGTTPDLFYVFYSAIEISCTLFIVWYAWTWRNHEGQP